jgi:DNA-binding transcriptional ArsR family regulator
MRALRGHGVGREIACETEEVFAALADRTRLEILARLKEGEASAGEIAQGFRISRPAISRHVRVLRQARLLHERREGRNLYYALNAEPLGIVDRWLAQYRAEWRGRLGQLKRHAEAGFDK